MTFILPRARRLRFPLLSLAACLVSAPPAVQAQAEAEIAWPAPRATHAMIWHGGVREVLLLGGVAAAADSALWGWNGTRWARLAVGGPAGRGHFAMSYDAGRDRLVVQGGFGAVFGVNNPPRYGDTWEWDRRTWRRVGDGGPGLRDHHAMVYDPVRKVTVLFGGRDSSGGILDDTWTWNGRVWRRIDVAGPGARTTHRMVFDTKRGVVVMYGGWGAGDVMLGDTWEWNGLAWRRAADAGPSPRFAMRMAYDEARARTVLFGGRSGPANFGDTWEFDGTAWRRAVVSGPSLRNVHEMVYDARARRVLLFGGFNAPVNYDDFWSFDGAWRQISRPDARPVDRTYAARGPHAVGHRVIAHWDRSRRAAPARDFEGRPGAEDGGVPMQVNLWYPAQPGGTPIRVGEYYALEGKTQTLEPVSAADFTATSASIRRGGAMLGVELSEATADSIRDLPATAVRDAVPAAGRFPLVVIGGSGTDWALGEYLASHGYVVVTAPTVGTASQQVTRVPVAIETHTRNMEVSQAVAAALPFVDATRVGLIGTNFDGLAALNHQMRNMGAAAVVSLDGYETKIANAGGLRGSPYFDATRMRVPYLSFTQDNQPMYAFKDSLARALKYAERYAYVVRDMEHAHLIVNLMVYPQLRAEQRLGYDFVRRTTRTFLDAYVKGDTSARVSMARSAVQNGYPAWLVETELKLPALPAVPIAEEVERIAMSGDVERLAGVYRRARAADSSARLFGVGDLNLFAFRFARQNRPDVAIAFQQLAVEAFTRSTNAANNLGNTYREAGQTARALEWFEKALALVDADPDLSATDKAQSRTLLQQKIRQLRPSPAPRPIDTNKDQQAD